MTKENDKITEEIVKKLAKNLKIQKAMKGLLEPLEQEGDSLTIKFGDEEVNIKGD